MFSKFLNFENGNYFQKMKIESKNRKYFHKPKVTLGFNSSQHKTNKYFKIYFNVTLKFINLIKYNKKR